MLRANSQEKTTALHPGRGWNQLVQFLLIMLGVLALAPRALPQDRTFSVKPGSWVSTGIQLKKGQFDIKEPPQTPETLCRCGQSGNGSQESGGRAGSIRSFEEFRLRFGHRFKSVRELLTAWRVYQAVNKCDDAVIVLGRLNETKPYQNRAGYCVLRNLDPYTIAINDVFLYAGVDRVGRFLLVSEMPPEVMRGQDNFNAQQVEQDREASAIIIYNHEINVLLSTGKYHMPENSRIPVYLLYQDALREPKGQGSQTVSIAGTWKEGAYGIIVNCEQKPWNTVHCWCDYDWGGERAHQEISGTITGSSIQTVHTITYTRSPKEVQRYTGVISSTNGKAYKIVWRNNDVWGRATDGNAKPPDPFNRGISQPRSQATVPTGTVISVALLDPGFTGQGVVPDGVIIDGRQVIPRGTDVAITQTMAAGGSQSFQLELSLRGKLYRVRASGIRTSRGWEFHLQEGLKIE